MLYLEEKQMHARKGGEFEKLYASGHCQYILCFSIWGEGFFVWNIPDSPIVILSNILAISSLVCAWNSDICSHQTKFIVPCTPDWLWSLVNTTVALLVLLQLLAEITVMYL